MSWGFNARGIFHPFKDNIPGAVAAWLYCYNVYTVFWANKSTYGIYWSLSLEEQFYLLFPFFLLLVVGRWRRLAALSVIAGAVVFIPWATRGGFRYEGIVYGVMIYLIAPRLNVGNVPKTAGFMLMGALAALLVCGPRIQFLPTEIVYQIPALASSALVILAIQNVGFIPALNERCSKIVDWIGTRSFGLYLIHLPAYQFSSEFLLRFGHLHRAGWRALLAMTVIVAVTEFCYRFIETPTRNWGRRKAEAISHSVQDNVGLVTA
jgi:peptidoglycan/LPS O-acetylase OafA/YrhL